MDVEADKRLAEDVRNLLRSSFEDHRCLTAQQCADALEISVRSMQRRLSALDMTFSALVDEVRFDLAREKLLDTGDTIDSIAQALGYSTPEGFIRAFNRWSSINPGDFRRQGHV
jgi:AraC-like DNA-binding protein